MYIFSVLFSHFPLYFPAMLHPTVFFDSVIRSLLFSIMIDVMVFLVPFMFDVLCGIPTCISVCCRSKFLPSNCIYCAFCLSYFSQSSLFFTYSYFVSRIFFSFSFFHPFVIPLSPLHCLSLSICSTLSLTSPSYIFYFTSASLFLPYL